MLDRVGRGEREAFSALVGVSWLAVRTAASRLLGYGDLWFGGAGESSPPEQVGSGLASQNAANFVFAAATPSLARWVISAAGFVPTSALMAVPAATSAVIISGRGGSRDRH